MNHPGGEILALYAGGDLSLWRRWQVSRHAASCQSCREEISAFRNAREVLRQDASELPPEVDWDRLAVEMNANIRLGLVAGQCVGAERPAEGPRHGERLSWRAAAALAMMTLVVLTGWFLNAPRPEVARNRSEGFVLESTSVGIGLTENGRGLTLLSPSQSAVTYSANAEGSLRARYVDADTGQVTITNVYAE